MFPPEVSRKTYYEVMNHYINWNDGRLKNNSEYYVRKYLQDLFDYEVIISNCVMDLAEIDKGTQGYWTAYKSETLDLDYHYFFQLEEDAVAFKLKWS